MRWRRWLLVPDVEPRAREVAAAQRLNERALIVDAAAGVAWTRGRWQIAGGYELATWFNVGEIDRASHDLLLDGFFLRTSFGW